MLETFTIVLTVTVNAEDWANEYGLEPTSEAVRADFIAHAHPNFDTTVPGSELEPGHIVTAWDGLVTEVTATVQ